MSSNQTARCYGLRPFRVCALGIFDAVAIKMLFPPLHGPRCHLGARVLLVIDDTEAFYVVTTFKVIAVARYEHLAETFWTIPDALLQHFKYLLLGCWSQVYFEFFDGKD